MPAWAAPSRPPFYLGRPLVYTAGRQTRSSREKCAARPPCTPTFSSPAAATLAPWSGDQTAGEIRKRGLQPLADNEKTWRAMWSCEVGRAAAATGCRRPATRSGRRTTCGSVSTPTWPSEWSCDAPLRLRPCVMYHVVLVWAGQDKILNCPVWPNNLSASVVSRYTPTFYSVSKWFHLLWPLEPKTVSQDCWPSFFCHVAAYFWSMLTISQRTPEATFFYLTLE